MWCRRRESHTCIGKDEVGSNPRLFIGLLLEEPRAQIESQFHILGAASFDELTAVTKMFLVAL